MYCSYLEVLTAACTSLQTHGKRLKIRVLFEVQNIKRNQMAYLEETQYLVCGTTLDAEWLKFKSVCTSSYLF